MRAWALAASPPQRINFQGVLRDSAGGPAEGDFPMVFRFYDSVGTEVPCDCCTGHPEPGCSDPVCEAEVCGILPDCCNSIWDAGICGATAAQLLSSCQSCCDPPETLLFLTDEHIAGDAGPVTVAGGLFDVVLGSGTIVAGVESTLGEVFANWDEVYLEIEVNGGNSCAADPRGSVGLCAQRRSARRTGRE